MYKVNGIFYYKIFLYSTGNYNFLHMLERLNGEPFDPIFIIYKCSSVCILARI